jgi:hypothetical protein
VIYRGLKPEMKTAVTAITHAATTDTYTFINSLAEGAGQNDRIGARVKIHYIEVQARCALPFRAELLLGNNLTTPSHTADQAVDRDIFNVLDRVYMNPNSNSGNAEFMKMDHKLPYGLIAKYSAATGADIQKGKLWLVLSSIAASTINGYVRIWYTDN